MFLWSRFFALESTEEKLMQAQIMHLQYRLVVPLRTVRKNKSVSEPMRSKFRLREPVVHLNPDGCLSFIVPRTLGTINVSPDSQLINTFVTLHFPVSFATWSISKLHSNRFKIKKFYVVFTLHLCVLHRFKNRQQHTLLTHRFNNRGGEYSVNA